jgi:RNA polymerase sigma factor (sigma-70 family)
MHTTAMSEVIGRLRDILGSHGNSPIVDAELLRRFVQDKDHAAFEALVRRHGPMVLGVCHRVLRCRHDVEDAFQATFLVLLRKAASLRSPSKIGNWLYGVAYRTAVQARDAATKRRSKEAAVIRQAEKPENVWTDLLPAVDKELERLPEKYRLPLVLCHLEGRTRKVVARELGLPEGTVASRLARARTLLAKRLTRRGITITGGAVGTVLSESALSASIPPSLVVSVTHAAVLVAAGRVADGGLSAKVISLAKGALRTMLLRKLAKGIAVLLISAVVATGVGFMLAPSLASGTDNMQQAATTGAATEATVTVGVSHLQSVFLVNDAAADVKYTGKVIQVSGKMVKIRSVIILKPRAGYVHAYLMTLESAYNALLPVVFEFDADKRDQLASLKTGDDLIVEGNCAGRNNDPEYKEGIVRFKDCKIISTAK